MFIFACFCVFFAAANTSIPLFVELSQEEKEKELSVRVIKKGETNSSCNVKKGDWIRISLRALGETSTFLHVSPQCGSHKLNGPSHHKNPSAPEVQLPQGITSVGNLFFLPYSADSRLHVHCSFLTEQGEAQQELRVRFLKVTSIFLPPVAVIVNSLSIRTTHYVF